MQLVDRDCGLDILPGLNFLVGRHESHDLVPLGLGVDELLVPQVSTTSILAGIRTAPLPLCPFRSRSSGRKPIVRSRPRFCSAAFAARPVRWSVVPPSVR